MMKETIYQALIDSMAQFIHGKQTDVSLEDAAWKELYLLSLRQSLSGALCTTLSQASMPAAVRTRLQQDAAKTLSRSQEQRLVRDEIAAALSEAGITHLFFKGAVVREYYPDPLLRSMGDIDMAIRFADRDAVYERMTAMGFSCVDKSEEVWSYQRFQTLVEVHTVVKQFDAIAQDTKEYEDIFADTVPVSGTTVRWSDEREAAHCIAHLTLHFCGGGCGLRMLMDVGVLYERFPEAAFWERVLARLEPIGIAAFARRVLWLCREWLGVAVDDTLVVPLQREDAARMREYLLSEGTFGTDSRIRFAQMRRDRKKKRSRVGAFFRWVFPPVMYVRRRYGYAGKHGWLVPFAYIHRLFDGVLKNRRIHENRRQYALQNEETMEAEMAFFDAVGL